MPHPSDLLGHRVESFFLELLDEKENRIGWANGFESGQVDFNWDAQIPGGFKATLVKLGRLPFSWGTVRFRPWVRVNMRQWPLGVFLPISSEMHVTEEDVSYNISAVDKLTILQNQSVTSTYSVAAGSVITDAVKTVIQEAGEASILITASEKTTDDLMVWPAGTTRLKIVNDLLDKINYEHLWTDGYGRFRAGRMINLETAPAVHDFVRGDKAVHSAEFKVTQDFLNVPNEVVCITQSSADNPGLISVVLNNDPTSPYSVQARGRIITKTYTGVEASDQETLDRIAHRNLMNSSTPAEYIVAQTLILPTSLRDVITFTDQGMSGVRAWVNEWSLKLEDGELIDVKWLVIGTGSSDDADNDAPGYTNGATTTTTTAYVENVPEPDPEPVIDEPEIQYDDEGNPI